MRSILFVPADRPDRYGKALEAGADAVCVDLEDAVAPAAKASARAAVANFLSERTPRGPRVLVRVNDPESRQGQADVMALEGREPPDAFVVPKVTRASGLRRAHAVLGGSVPAVPIVETPAALDRVGEIARAAAEVGPATGARGGVAATLAFGGFDLAAAIGAVPEWEPLLYARSRIVAAAAVEGLDVVDMPWIDLRDDAGLRTEARRARRLGCTGKMAVHPGQVSAIHEAFTPTPEEVERARAIVRAHRSADGGVLALDGRMLDRPMARRAERTLARAGVEP